MIGFLLGALILGAVLWTIARMLQREYRQVRELRRRYGLSWHQAYRFRSWLTRRADDELFRAWRAGRISLDKWHGAATDAYYAMWVDRFLNRSKR